MKPNKIIKWSLKCKHIRLRLFPLWWNIAFTELRLRIFLLFCLLIGYIGCYVLPGLSSSHKLYITYSIFYNAYISNKLNKIYTQIFKNCLACKLNVSKFQTFSSCVKYVRIHICKLYKAMKLKFVTYLYNLSIVNFLLFKSYNV